MALGRFHWKNIVKKIRGRLMAGGESGPTGFRANLQIGLTSTVYYYQSRYYTNLAVSARTWASATVNYDDCALYPQYFDSATGGIKGVPQDGRNINQMQGRITPPWPRGAEPGRWIRMWCNRNDGTLQLTGVGSQSKKTAATAWKGGTYVDFWFSWTQNDPLVPDSSTVGWRFIPNPAMTPGDGSAPAVVYAAEIRDPANPGAEIVNASVTNTSWDWIIDPTVSSGYLHWPSLDRLKMFGTIRPMDLQGTNSNWCMMRPSTAANRSKFGGSTGATSANGGSTEGMGATVVYNINGSNVVINAGHYTTEVHNESAPGLYAGTPWRPWAEFGNQISFELAVADTTPYTMLLEWSGKATKIFKMTVPPGTTWNQLSSLLNAHQQGFAGACPRSEATCIISRNVTVPSALNGVVVTPQPPTMMSGGRSGDMGGEMPTELLVAMCNYTNCNLWFQIPINADESWVRANIAILRDGLNPGLKVYAEMGNELWNSGFHSRQELMTWGFANNPFGFTNEVDYPKAHMWAWGKKFVTLMTWAKDEFGLNGGRQLDIVMAGQQVSGGTNSHWPTMSGYSDYGTAWNNLINWFAVAPYWTSKFSSGGNTNALPWVAGANYYANPNAGVYPLLTYNGVLYAITANHTSAIGSEPDAAGGAAYYTPLTPAYFEAFGKAAIDNVFSACGASINFAATKGKGFIGYEYGIGDKWISTNSLLAQFALDLNHSNEMYRLYSYSLWKFYSVGGSTTLIPQFGDTYKPLASNMWQWQDYDGAPDAVSPKRRALQDFIINGPYNPYP